MPKKRKPKIISKAILETKNTRELLGYLKRLHQCEASFELSDMIENKDLEDVEIIYFKKSEKWKNAYENVKSILKNREHIE